MHFKEVVLIQMYGLSFGVMRVITILTMIFTVWMLNVLRVDQEELFVQITLIIASLIGLTLYIPGSCWGLRVLGWIGDEFLINLESGMARICPGHIWDQDKKSSGNAPAYRPFEEGLKVWVIGRFFPRPGPICVEV